MLSRIRYIKKGSWIDEKKICVTTDDMKKSLNEFLLLKNNGWLTNNYNDDERFWFIYMINNIWCHKTWI